MVLGAALGQGRQDGTQSLGEGRAGGTTQDGGGEAMGVKLVGELAAYLF